MGAESHLTRSLLAAAQGRWDDVDWSRTKDEIKRYRDGSDAEPGSDNHPTLSYGIALIAAWKRPGLLTRLGTTWAQVIAWWKRELTVRLRKGLMLTEERSRIYCIWEQALICWMYRAFVAFPELRELHRRYVRATAAMVALCAYPVRPLRYDPPIDAKVYKRQIFVPLAGARSWSTEGKGSERHAHHMGQSAWEVFASGLLDIDVPDEFRWERSLLAALTPGWMGLTTGEVSIFRAAVRHGATSTADDLLDWLYGVGTRWRCYLVRFEHGAGCFGLDRAINGNTDSMPFFAVHRDGTIDYHTIADGDRGAEIEPCGVDITDHGNDRLDLYCWHGGEDYPREGRMYLASRYGPVRWLVELRPTGDHKIHRPRKAEPVPPPGPNPPEIPDSSDPPSWWSRYRYRAIAGAVFLASVLWALNQRGCFK